MGPFLRVQSPKFAIMPGEADELVNEGMYGKALAEYLTERLRQHGYNVPFFCCEDWGWWIELSGHAFTFGVCIYGMELRDGSLDMYVTDGATAKRQWSWRRLRFIDTTPFVEKLHAHLFQIFSRDAEVRLLATDLDSPLFEEPSA